jgi:hypothetical protein
VGWSLPEAGNFYELFGMMKPSCGLIIPHSDSISAGNLKKLILILQQLTAGKSLLPGEGRKVGSQSLKFRQAFHVANCLVWFSLLDRTMPRLCGELPLLRLPGSDHSFANPKGTAMKTGMG